jgi:hypothetical protein
MIRQILEDFKESCSYPETLSIIQKAFDDLIKADFKETAGLSLKEIRATICAWGVPDTFSFVASAVDGSKDLVNPGMTGKQFASLMEKNGAFDGKSREPQEDINWFEWNKVLDGIFKDAPEDLLEIDADKYITWHREYDWVDWEEFRDSWFLCSRCGCYDEHSCICYAR